MSPDTPQPLAQRPPLLLSKRAGRMGRAGSLLGRGALLLVASTSALAVLSIFYCVVSEALPFFTAEGFTEFFFSKSWYPSREPPEFGALAIFVGAGLVTLGAALVATPIGVCAAVCLSDILPFRLRQTIKPIVEILAAIPSVAYGFFALVVVAPLLLTFFVSGMAAARAPERLAPAVRTVSGLALAAAAFWGLARVAADLGALRISSGANALNVSIILGVMALPTVVSVAEDALQAVGRGLREGSYALGATRAETVVRVVMPAASSGVFAALALGVMRAVGETMVVWMASGNAAQIPKPWYNLLAPVRTLTATIAGDMGEADHVTGSSRYHALFAMALCLVAVSFALNLAGEVSMRRARKKLGNP